MQNPILRLISISIFIAGCSSAPKVTSSISKASPLMNELNGFVGQMNIANCQESIATLRKYVRTINLQKNVLDQPLQNHLFQMRLNIKNIYAEGVQTSVAKECVFEAKQALSDLRSLEEALGQAPLHQKLSRGVASQERPSMFTDSYRQLVSNPRRDDSVSSLLDLKTGDILLLHRMSSENAKAVTDSQGAMDWTDIVVVYKDDVDDLYLLTVMGNQVKRRGWYQMGDWLKRSVDRVQVLRPESSKDLALHVGRLQDRKIKNAHSFGNLIKKELKLKTSSTIVVGVGEAVLGEDLEMSPDLTILSEWKDYSFAYKSRMLTQILKLIFPSLSNIGIQNDSDEMTATQKNSYLVDDVITRGVTNH